MENGIILSIVMMIKNEEKYLDETLKALESLRDNLESELIIVDTGSTDSSIDIARKYTDKVYSHIWNDNFAEMRNISISYAKGEWILVLDADEKLIDYEKLINFFTSGTYKNYNSASIKLKNLHSEDKEKFSMATMVRLFKNSQDFRYEGSIHEQPIYKQPTYNSNILFEHYGYMFINEELRQLKDNRNKSILLKEYSDNPEKPYINYQLGKQYMISNEFEDAAYYMENSYKLYSKGGYVPKFVSGDLANLYIHANKISKCEELCSSYIKKDKLNIDIYYYLATSQMLLKKYKESIKAYKRYLYLLDNYDSTTQANSIDCYSDTVSYKDQCEVMIIKNYYNLDMYKEVISEFNKAMDNKGKDSEIYFMLVDSLYRANNLKEIKKYYENIGKTQNDKNEFILATEKLLLNIKNKNKDKLIQELTHMGDNYGKLNEIRMGYEENIDEYIRILKEEKASYYGDILYYSFKNSQDVIELLKELDVVYLQDYINYIVMYRRDIILDLYNFIVEQDITLDESKIKVYKCIAKALLLTGGLLGEKYENLFNLYKTYTWLLLKEKYNPKLSDEEILNFTTDFDERFVLKLKVIENIKQNNKIDYIRNLKHLLLEYPQHKKGIQILIDAFEEELKESEELQALKVQYKSIIENNINNGNIIEAEKMIEEYETIFSLEDIGILNMKFIISMYNNSFKDAQDFLKRAFLLDVNNFNTIFNIAYLKEMLGDTKEAIRFYERIVANCVEEDIVLEAREKIEFLKRG